MKGLKRKENIIMEELAKKIEQILNQFIQEEIGNKSYSL